MKKLFIPLVMAAAVAMTGCSEDFEVAAPYKDVTVVYGILDPLDTAHYIRIQKAFLDENKSAIDMSKVPDSSYYESLTVTMKEFSDARGAAYVRSVPLSAVDMNFEGFVKDQPANEQGFFQSPNKAYKFKMDLNPNYSYRLIIQNNKTGNIDSSDLLLMVNPDSTKGTNRFYISAFNNATYSIDFSKTALNNPTFSLLGNAPLNSRFLEGVIRFHYVEKNISTSATTAKYVDYKFDRDDQPTTQFKLEVNTRNIYGYLADAIGTAPANVERYMDSCDVFVYAGDNYLYTYEQVNMAQSGGIAADQIKPYYTNIKSTSKAVGIVGSRTYRVFNNAPLTQATVDSLMTNPITSGLNIKGRSDK